MARHFAMTIGLLLGAVSMPGHAQSFLGRLGGHCAPVPAVPSLLVPLGATASAGNTLIVTVAVSSEFVSDLSISDSIGNRYQAIGGIENSVAGSVVHFRAALQRSVPAGQNLQVVFENAGSNVSACASVLAYSGIAFGSIVQQTLGTASGQSSSASVTTSEPGTTTRQLVLAGWATHANPGTVTPQPPASVLPTLCTGTSSLCLIDSQYFANPAGASSISLGFASSLDWAAAVTTLLADGIFGNGFD